MNQVASEANRYFYTEDYAEGLVTTKEGTYLAVYGEEGVLVALDQVVGLSLDKDKAYLSEENTYGNKSVYGISTYIGKTMKTASGADYNVAGIYKK